MNQEITVIIVDDDDGSIKRLCEDLSVFPEIEIAATCHSPVKAQKVIISEQPDILFLDVEMPGMTGIELLKRIQPKLHPDTRVVFYTAYDQYLLDALRSSAFDYLLKPYLMEELEAIIERYHLSRNEAKGQPAVQSLNQLLEKNTLAIQTVSGLMMVPCEKILLFDFIKECKCWQMALTGSDKPFRLRQNTRSKELLAVYDAFVQISKECIVNLNYILAIENKSLCCRFAHPYSEIERSASDRYYKRIRERLVVF